MRLNRLFLNLCIIPFICVIPLFGTSACSSDQATDIATQGASTVQQSISDLSENAQAAAPYIQEDLEKLWGTMAGNIDVYAEQLGVEQPSHELVCAEEAREKLISGESFNDVVAKALSELTPEDLQGVSSQELNQLNGILPFDIDLTTCGENLAEVLNNLDIGQVSAILQSDAGYHLIQVIDRDGMNVKIGHILFQVVPPAGDQATQPPSQDTEASDPLNEAFEHLTEALVNK
jgi:hypothetical protein